MKKFIGALIAVGLAATAYSAEAKPHRAKKPKRTSHKVVKLHKKHKVKKHPRIKKHVRHHVIAKHHAVKHHLKKQVKNTHQKVVHEKRMYRLTVKSICWLWLFTMKRVVSLAVVNTQ